MFSLDEGQGVIAWIVGFLVFIGVSVLLQNDCCQPVQRVVGIRDWGAPVPENSINFLTWVVGAGFGYAAGKFFDREGS